MTYTYICFPFKLVVNLDEAKPKEAKPVNEALHDGYRWVRTDGEFAIFEKVTGTLTDREAWLLSDVSHITRTKIDSTQYLELQVLARKLYNWRKKQ
jgi:hypothetical protein